VREPRFHSDGEAHLWRQLSSMAPHRALVRAVESWLLANVKLEAPALDLGCGEGHFAGLAFDPQPDVAIDLAVDAVAEASRRHQYGAVVCGDARRLPFGNEVFRSVVSNSALEHVDGVDAALREARRVLRPGGTLVATTPTDRFEQELLGCAIGRRLGLSAVATAYGRFFSRISRHYHAEEPQIWRGRLARAGFDVIHHATYFPPSALRVFDLCHYHSVPFLLARRTIGTWVLHPIQTEVFFQWLRRHVQDGPEHPDGVYQLVVCRRAG
jgi:SAM-dependent methyltransferase